MRIVVTDAAGRPLRDAAVAVDGGAPAAVDANGALSLPEPTAATTYHASRARLHPVSVQVQPGAEWTWDDPGSTLSPRPLMTLTIPLPAIAAAPTERRDDAELTYDPKLPNPSRPTRPQGILLDAGGRPYGLEDGPLSFHLAGPDLLGDPAADGWRKLDDVAAGQVNPAARGQFAFLEWGGMEGTPRLLVAVWAPWPRGPAELRPRSDAAVYFSPTTTRERGYPEDAPPYRGEYPYGLVPEGGHWMQNYAGLPIRHMFRERFMAYQLIAARRRAPLIFPVQPAAHWQAFATPAGVGRMVSEVLLWLHRLQAPLLSYPPRSMPPGPPQRRLGAWQPPPKLRQLACSGFSAGVGALARLIEKADLPGGFGDDVFGAEGEAMQNAWKELWDFDGPRYITGATAQWEKKLAAWCGQHGSNRAVALYHTERTSWSAADIASLNSLFPKSKSVPRHSGDRLAVYRAHITRGSAAFFGTRYLFNGPPGPGWQRSATAGRAKDAPEFWEQRHKTEPEAVHLMIPMFAFGHAAGMSSLQNLS